MADIPEKDLEGTRAALAPTLEATAAILPWVAKPQPVRFPPELNKRWEAAWKELADCWHQRQTGGQDPVRAAIFAVLSIAIEANDVDCLGLAEALASTADRFDADGGLSPRVIAALTATIETLQEPGGLEHVNFVTRAQHFSQRIHQSLAPSRKPGERSDVLDALFVEDTQERLERMYESLIVLPIDVYALQIDCQELIQQAEQIEMWGIYHLARQLESFVVQLSDASEATQDAVRSEIEKNLDTLATALAVING